MRATLYFFIRGGRIPYLVVGSLVVLLGSSLLFREESPRPIEPCGWDLSQFVDHVKAHGISVRVVEEQGVRPFSQVILTEDPDLTWESARIKVKYVESIHQWRDTVAVWKSHPEIEMDGQLAMWGPHGCQIGDFLLFGDRRLLLRICAAFVQ